ncbi:hypothetical protein ACSFA0_26020 [Variovorax sp. LT1P1]|uniref:hypothetical protein n=1 Tax=Variovorax sp. LT1P1 TaxID=3443730 RepID=UPI003F45E759
MDKTPHSDYFTDNQVATTLGITLRSLRNKIHRDKGVAVSSLPPFHLAAARGRLWDKEALSAFLLEQWQDAGLVNTRMALGALAPPLGVEGATDVTLKLRRWVLPKGPTRQAAAKQRKMAS